MMLYLSKMLPVALECLLLKMVGDLIIKRHFICFTLLNALAVTFWTDQCPK